MVALGEQTIPNGQELLAEFIQYGRQQPFEEIVRRYAGMVFNVCYRITKDKHEAEDATQAVFLTLALQAKRGADIKALGPWLQQVAKRLALDTRRSKKRRVAREERHQTEQTIRRESLLDDALPPADLDELKAVLHEELQKLPAKYRLPLILHYFGGLSRDEMAAELNCKPSTLGVRIFRGREMLAGRLTSRGINISGGMLAMVMGLLVRHAVSQTLISSTSYAATAMMAGHDGVGMASAHVIGLTRRATSAMALGKVRITAITLLMAATSLGAGAKALGMLPQIDVQRMIANQIERIIRPLIQPLTRPLRVDATTASTKTTIATATSGSGSQPVNLSDLIAHTNPPVKIGCKAVSTAGAKSANGDIVAVAANTPAGLNPLHVITHSQGSFSSAGVDHSSTSNSTAKSADAADMVASADTSGSDGSGGGGGAGGIADMRASDPLPSRSTTFGLSHTSDVVITVNDLFVGSASRSLAVSADVASASASPAAVIAIPAVGGTVTESSNGIVRGWGTINRTGTLDMNGKVVADGQGIDRTLNLSSFTSVQTLAGLTSPATTIDPQATATPITPASTTRLGDGYYAINHGRLTLPLIPSSTDASTLTWGDNPDAPQLSLANSVRIALQTDGSTAAATPALPTQLSLLSSERSDVPNLSEISGATLGLWQVDAGTSLPDSELTICYDPTLIDELGANLSSLNLWTYGDASGTWQPVNPSTFSLDAADHLVSGDASDINYFALSVAPGQGLDVEQVVASHLAEISGDTTPAQAPAGVQGVPEPAALSLLVLTPMLLGRRRRRSLSA